MNVQVNPLEDAAGSPFVRLTGSCTVPESSEVRESSRGRDWLLDVNLPGPKLVSQGASGFRN